MAFSSNQELLSDIHRNVEDDRVNLDILELKRRIKHRKEVVLQEVKYVCPSLNIADALIKTTKMKEVLQLLLQTGRYDLPDGFLDLGTKEQSQHLAHHITSGRYDLPGEYFELGMTERSQQPLRKPHVIIEKKNPSNE